MSTPLTTLFAIVVAVVSVVGTTSNVGAGHPAASGDSATTAVLRRAAGAAMLDDRDRVNQHKIDQKAHHFGLRHDFPLPPPSDKLFWQPLQQSLHTAANHVKAGAAAAAAAAAAAPFPIHYAKFNDELAAKWQRRGKSLLARGRVAVVLLAGGLGTRVGSNTPKGMLDIQLPSQRSLFQMHAEMVLAQQHQAGANSIPLCVMTSPMLFSAIVNAFEAHDYFGLDREQVHFFNQTTLPCFHHDGTLFLETSRTGKQVAMSPGGHGDLFHALEMSGLLERLKSHGVTYVASFNVDNPLSFVPDPKFLGFCASLSNTPLCYKVVDHSRPNEPLNTILLNRDTGMAQYYSYHSYHAAAPATTSKSVAKGDIMHLIATIEFIERINANLDVPPLHKVPARIKRVLHRRRVSGSSDSSDSSDFPGNSRVFGGLEDLKGRRQLSKQNLARSRGLRSSAACAGHRRVTCHRSSRRAHPACQGAARA